jgi:hypothetical protein
VAWIFGVTLLYLLLTYNDAADLEVNHEEPGPTVIEVPAKKRLVAAKSLSNNSFNSWHRSI